MDSNVALLLASVMWSVVALVLGIRLVGRRLDGGVKKLTESAHQRLDSLVIGETKASADLFNLTKQVETLANRLAKLEAPVMRKNVQF